MGPRASPPTGFFWSYPRGCPPDTSGGGTKADFKTAAVLQWLGDDGGDAWRDERAADPLHCPRIDAKPSSDFALTGPSGSLQCLMDSFFQGGGSQRPPEAFSLIPDSRKPGTDSLAAMSPQSFQNPLNRSGAKAV